MNTMHYLVASAMRGPDLHCRYLKVVKNLVTSRLRGIYYGPDEVHGEWTRQPLNLSGIQTLTEALKMVGKTYSKKHTSNRDQSGVLHYISHMESAIGLTWNHTVWGGRAEQIATALRHTAEYILTNRGKP